VDALGQIETQATTDTAICFLNSPKTTTTMVVTTIHDTYKTVRNPWFVRACMHADCHTHEIRQSRLLRCVDTDLLARLPRHPRHTNGSCKTEYFAKPKYCPWWAHQSSVDPMKIMDANVLFDISPPRRPIIRRSHHADRNGSRQTECFAKPKYCPHWTHQSSVDPMKIMDANVSFDINPPRRPFNAIIRRSHHADRVYHNAGSVGRAKVHWYNICAERSHSSVQRRRF
jgi:hypothetical protein